MRYPTQTAWQLRWRQSISQHAGSLACLYGVYVADTRPFCDSTFRPTRCQTRAAIALASRIHGFVRYVPQVTYSDRSIGAYCSVAGSGTPSRQIDLGACLIDQGWAVALPQAPFAYHTLEEIAKVNGRRGAFRPIVSSDSGAGALAISLTSPRFTGFHPTSLDLVPPT